MSLIILPQYLINKILQWNIHPIAELVKEKILEDLDFEHIHIMLNAFGLYHFYRKLNVIQRIHLTNKLNKTKYRNTWEFCCTRGITVLPIEIDHFYDHIDHF